MKQYVAIVKDHSGSISAYRLNEACRKDYNLNVATLKDLAAHNNIKTYLTVIECGAEHSPGLVRVACQNMPIEQIYPTATYVAQGGRTPLFDSIGKAIEIFEKVPDEPDTAFLVMAVTDGENNMQSFWNSGKLSKKIKELQNTDKWTFTFSVPRGYKQALVGLGIPSDNISEWEQTTTGAEKATEEKVTAVTQYYGARATGQTSTQKFFTNIGNVSKETVKATLRDITSETRVLRVTDGYQGSSIKSFVEYQFNVPYVKGQAFYELVKQETIQPQKLIVVRDIASGRLYAGNAARDLLGMDKWNNVKVMPGNHGGYEIYVQSTSVNRILPVGTKVLLWTQALNYVH